MIYIDKTFCSTCYMQKKEKYDDLKVRNRQCFCILGEILLLLSFKEFC